jgi:CheY-like chemotaxis protein
VRKVMARLISSLGHTVTEASNGLEALAAVKISMANELEFDVILMDNQMPGMIGPDAVKIMRSELKFDGLIFGVTGNALQKDVQDFYAVGANEVVIKPLTEEIFNHLLAIHVHNTTKVEFPTLEE